MANQVVNGVQRDVDAVTRRWKRPRRRTCCAVTGCREPVVDTLCAGHGLMWEESWEWQRCLASQTAEAISRTAFADFLRRIEAEERVAKARAAGATQ
jgi:hypothetical protein